MTNDAHLVKDLTEGDVSVAEREDFDALSSDELKTALKVIIDNPTISEKDKKYLIFNSWRISYKTKPSQFLLIYICLKLCGLLHDSPCTLYL